MGKRGPKKGHGGRPKKTKSSANPITQLYRLKKRELQARKSGQLEKAQQIQNEIEKLSVDFEKNKNVKESFLTATKELDKMRNESFDVKISQAHATTVLSGAEPVSFEDLQLKIKQSITGEKEHILNSKIRIDPLYQTFSPEKQKEIDEAFLKTLDLMDVMFAEKVVEVEQYTKMRIDQWAEKMLTNIKKLVEVYHSQKQTKNQIIKEKTK